MYVIYVYIKILVYLNIIASLTLQQIFKCNGIQNRTRMKNKYLYNN